MAGGGGARGNSAVRAGHEGRAEDDEYPAVLHAGEELPGRRGRGDAGRQVRVQTRSGADDVRRMDQPFDGAELPRLLHAARRDEPDAEGEDGPAEDEGRDRQEPAGVVRVLRRHVREARRREDPVVAAAGVLVPAHDGPQQRDLRQRRRLFAREPHRAAVDGVPPALAGQVPGTYLARTWYVPGRYQVRARYRHARGRPGRRRIGRRHTSRTPSRPGVVYSASATKPGTTIGLPQCALPAASVATTAPPCAS